MAMTLTSLRHTLMWSMRLPHRAVISQDMTSCGRVNFIHTLLWLMQTNWSTSENTIGYQMVLYPCNPMWTIQVPSSLSMSQTRDWMDGSSTTRHHQILTLLFTGETHTNLKLTLQASTSSLKMNTALALTALPTAIM